ncbi:MAG: selenide, water dikinase SelD [Sphaerochaetaceae bacterium]|jgi:selenide,water dikinase|nr:selenide, water dikinase SelD [Sphaerochaetaceae bacterium]MDD4762455.1 selenide, water dikinase SelD [Sphaerochaetaceae bacterium]MDX9934334.1 selenide, water dikinase SelD [Sphaerochaetaceae bacterium]NLO61192.1 selenide, water dikinase SelD [Spirochaetales bacterium]
MDEKNIRLTEYSKFSGCGAKLTPAFLDKALCGLNQPKYERLLNDFSHAEDCGVYRITDDLALVQTIDFFPPVCDDPRMFGRIAAANALSDIYAMGATPITAVSIVGFPENQLDISYLKDILEGALDVLIESKTALVGGHSVKDSEVKFGLCVVGTVNPDLIWFNNRWHDQDVLILTKPIGSGIVQTAVRAQIASGEEEGRILAMMGTLNKTAANVLSNFSVHACTDVTGFGLLGHLCEMAIDNPIGMLLDVKNIPLVENVPAYASMGLIPTGAYTNKESRSSLVEDFDTLDDEFGLILFDPQTSGGLLAALPEEQAEKAIAALRESGIQASIIGKTDAAREGIKII